MKMNKLCFIDIKGNSWFLFRSTVKGLKIKPIKGRNKILEIDRKFYLITDCYEVELNGSEFDRLMNELF